jgi:hypothetical protein
MKTARSIAILAVLLILAATTVRAEFVVPAWETIGAQDASITRLFWSDWHGWLLFVGTPDGYQVLDERTELWTSHEEPGVPGREVTALSMVPRLQHRVLTGRLGADGHGSIELSFPVKSGERDDVVYTGVAGAVFEIVNRGFYDPILYAGTRALGETTGALIASADSGVTWQEITGHGHHDLTDIVCVYNDILYVSGDAGVMYTEDGGATWSPRNDGLPAGPVLHLWDDGPAIAIPAKDRREDMAFLFAAMADGVYFTPTGTVQWQRVLDDPAPRQILVQSDPYTSSYFVYVVTHDGRLLVSWYGEWEWTDLTGSLAGLDIVGLRSGYSILDVATAGDGVYRGEVPTGTDVPDAGAAFHLAVAPNPFNPRTTLSFTLPAAGQVQVTIHDARGLAIRRLVDDSLTAGTHAASWTGTDAAGQLLPSGTYFCRLTTPWGVQTRKLSLIR